MNPGSPAPVVVYAAVDKSLRVFRLDTQAGALELRQTVTDLANYVHYVALHPSGKVLYAAQSESPPPKDRPHVSRISAFAIDAGSGALTRLGDDFTPPLSRAVHISVDHTGRCLLMAHNFAESVSVLKLQPDGRLGELVQQAEERQGLGFLVHQVRVAPGNKWAFVPVRGDDPPNAKPGRLVVFEFDDGVLTKRRVVDYPPDLGPRHLDFHPSKPLVYLAVERGNLLITYKHEDGVLTELFRTNVLADPSFKFPAQRAGAIHVDPSGRFLYVTNRNIAPCPASGICKEDHVFSDGENTVAAFALDPNTGEPKLIQHIDAHGFEPRTMAIDPTRQFLIVANQKPVKQRQGEKLVQVAPNLSVFRIGDRGDLTYLHSHQPGGEAWWVGALALRS